MILPTHHTNPPSSFCFTPELIQNQIEMIGRSPIMRETRERMEFDNLSQLKEEPYLSGAYLCSLVKQLTPSRTSDSMNSKELGCVVDADVSQGQYSTKHGEVLDAQQAQQPKQPKQRKKQVRKRLQTSKSHQERLLNMAEARREIANALKHHRAAMKQASEKQQQQQPQEQQQQPLVSLQPPQQPNFEQEGRMKSLTNPRKQLSRTPDFSNYMDNFSYSSFSQPPPTAPNPFCWAFASPIAAPLLAENPNFILPSQTLGFNFHDFNKDASFCNSNNTSLYLNFHDFNKDASLCFNSNNSSLYPYSSPSSSSLPPVSVITDQELSSAAISKGEGSSQLGDIIDPSAATLVTGDLHMTMDDEGMAEIRSLGEQYQMEWNDKMNLVTSAWWFKFSQNMEHGATEANIEDDTYPKFEELMEFPASLSAKESCLEQCSEEYFQDPGLPW